MTFDVPPPHKVETNKAVDSRKLESSRELFNDVFGAKAPKQAEKGVGVQNLGRIASFTMPAGWVKGEELDQGAKYAKSFHPEGKDNTQIVLSYRGHRLSEGCSDAFRRLIDAAPNDRSGSSFDAKMMQQPPLNELMGDEGNKNTFQVVSAKVQKIHGEPALVVEGKYTNHDVNARFIYFDAERTNRSNGPAPVQEIAVIAPTKEFYKTAISATAQLDKIKWNK